MKKLGLLMVAMVLVGLMASCGEEKADTEESSISGTVWNLIDTKMPTTPDWVYGNAWYEGTWDGESVIMILVEGNAKTLEKAEIDAELSRIETLARAIKELSTAKLGAASSGMLNSDEDIDTYFEQTIAAVSQNVNTSGSRPVGSYWLHGEYINESEGTRDEVYRYYELFAMNKEQLQSAMEEAWNKTKEEYPEELQEEVGSTLDDLMVADDQLSAGYSY